MSGITDFFKSPVQAAFSSVMNGTSKIIQDFKADPTKVAEMDERLKELQINAQAAQDQLVTQLSDIHEKDLDSARTMNQNIVTSKEAPLIDKIVPYLLAALVTLGFFGILAYMLVRAVPAANKDIMNIMLGSLGTAWVSIVGFYFGSSASSKQKDETIKTMAIN